MISFLRKVYLAYCLSVFGVSFIIFFPLFIIPIVFRKHHKLVGVINRWWAKSVFTICFLHYEVELRAPLDPSKTYIFCPNHFSYIDIPSMGLNPHDAIFVGKKSMERVPLFGYMYKKLHITVDREKLSSRYSTYKKSEKAIDEGKSLVIFPEGGIITDVFPRMARFKDGAFKLSVAKQIPIVPVTIAFNWILLPGELGDLKWHPIKLIFHEPIIPNGKLADDLKKEVYNIIDSELRKVEVQYGNR